jgi:hypothetical protein
MHLSIGGTSHKLVEQARLKKFGMAVSFFSCYGLHITHCENTVSTVSLSDVLNAFVGAAIVVSHDEELCTRFKPTQIWTIDDHGRLGIEFPSQCTKR